MHNSRIPQPADIPRPSTREPTDVDDPPPPAALHVRRRRLRAPHVPHHLGVDVLQQKLVVGRRQRARHHPTRRRRIVHENIDPPELGHGRLDRILTGLRAGRVADDRNDAAPRGRRQRLRRLLEHAAIPRADRHVDAFARQLLCDRLADALAPARDDRDLPGQSQIHVQSPADSQAQVNSQAPSGRKTSSTSPGSEGHHASSAAGTLLLCRPTSSGPGRLEGPPGLACPFLPVGSVTRKVKPRSRLRVATMCPPCASTMERLMDNPMPSPSALLETKGSNMRSSPGPSTPAPVSVTVISMLPGFGSAVSMRSTRGPSETSAMAWQAMTCRLSNT